MRRLVGCRYVHPCNHMKPFTTTQEKLLLAIAAFGLIVPTGFFLYYALSGWPKLMSHFVKPEFWRKHSCFAQQLNP
jgi:hypothetical protein